MTKAEAIGLLKALMVFRHEPTEKDIEALEMAINALQEEEQDWIPFKINEYGELECKMPDEDQEIIVSNGKWVDTDTMCFGDEGYYLDSWRDFDGLAWMPMPKPWKGEQ